MFAVVGLLPDLVFLKAQQVFYLLSEAVHPAVFGCDRRVGKVVEVVFELPDLSVEQLLPFEILVV